MTRSLADQLREPRDRRSTGRSDDVASAVLAAPERFPELVGAMLDDDRLVRMRAVDAVEKVTRFRSDLLAPYTQTLLDRVALLPEPEVRWHIAQLLPRLPLTPVQRVRAIGLLQALLQDPSRIVQTCALQGLVELTDANADAGAREAVLALLRHHELHGSPAVRARARRLLAETGDEPTPPAREPGAAATGSET